MTLATANRPPLFTSGHVSPGAVERLFEACEAARMAGGMHRGGSRRNLAERAALSDDAPGTTTPDRAMAGVDPGRELPTARTDRPVRTGDGRHCWVHDPPDALGTWPGLLVEWRQRHGAWQGRVAYTVTGPDGPVLVETWLPAARLEPR